MSATRGSTATIGVLTCALLLLVIFGSECFGDIRNGRELNVKRTDDRSNAPCTIRFEVDGPAHKIIVSGDGPTRVYEWEADFEPPEDGR